MEPQTPSVTRGRSFLTVRGVAVITVVAWALYTLSIGPMFWTWFGARWVDGPEWVLAFYTPLQFVCEHVPYYGDLVENYIWWWNFPPTPELTDPAQQLVAG